MTSTNGQGDAAKAWLTETMWMRNLAGLENLSMDYLELLAGAVRSPVVHTNCDEIIYLLEGDLEFLLGDEVIAMHTGDHIAVPRGTPHGSVNRSGETVRMLAANSPPFRPEDETEISAGADPA